jgi:hypothetical protein
LLGLLLHNRQWEFEKEEIFMKTHLSGVLAIVLTLSGAFSSNSALGQVSGPIDNQSNDVSQPEDLQEDQGLARVARLSYIDGEVSFMRAGDREWIPAAQNLPLLSGDQVYTAPGARAEIQLARSNFVRLGEKTALTVADLSDSAAQLEITEGVAIIETSHLSGSFDRFEIDTPVAAVLIQQDGVYRIDVKGSGESEITVREGLAEVSTDDGDLKLRDGRRLLVGNGIFEVANVASFDNWDLWNTDRDSVAQSSYSSSPGYVSAYEDTYTTFYGADELAGCGTWTSVPSYGNCWVPRVAYGWAPYRFGEWVWIRGAGWCWRPNEPWGWAPYHYGRWQLIPGVGWAWIPGFRLQPGYNPVFYSGGYGYYRWRPALVYFYQYSGPRGQYVCWVPLGPRDAWHRPDWYATHPDPWRARYGSISGGWARPGTPRNGISVLPLEVFKGFRPGRPEPAGHQLSSALEPRRLPGAGAPGAEMVKPGLAGVTPSPFAKRPASVRGSTQVAAEPSREIVTRTVLTKHIPPTTFGDLGTGAGASREHRLVAGGAARAKGSTTAGSFDRGDGNGRNSSGNGSARTEASGSASPRMVDQGSGRRGRFDDSRSGYGSAAGLGSSPRRDEGGSSNYKTNSNGGGSRSYGEERRAERSGAGGGAASPARVERSGPPPPTHTGRHENNGPSASSGSHSSSGSQSSGGSHSNSSGSQSSGGSHSNSSGSQSSGGSHSSSSGSQSSGGSHSNSGGSTSGGGQKKSG